jgi:hypothetical protein
VTPVLALLTDFGPGSVYVGQMHLAIRRELPEATIVDLAHDCPRGDIEAAAYLLRAAAPVAIPASVTVVVVDPGVGGDRRVLAGRVDGRVFVGPDNGVLAAALEEGEVRAFENRALLDRPVSATFEGRDVMAPLGARIAAGMPLGEVGPAAAPRTAPPGPVPGAEGVDGRVLLVDRFGNLVTNVPGTRLASKAGLAVRVGGRKVVGLSRTFADVEPGALLCYVGSGGHLEVAVNGESAARRLGVNGGEDVEVRWRAG